MNQLHPIAQAVQSQGRGKDTQLVHMTPNEVQGLHALAKAHGGSLSINPSTGLPEAGFLDSMLPTILGVGLAAATGGTSLAFINPTTIGLGIGALQYARTGSLEKGLMAGLGAYGGAGLGTSLMGAGATAASGVTAGVTPGVAGNIAAKTAGDFAAEKAFQEAAVNSATDVATRTAATEAAKNAGTNLAAQQGQIAAGNTFGQNFSNMGGGLKNVFSDPTTFMKNYGGSGMDLAKYGGAALSDPLMNAMTPEGGPGYKPDNERFDYTYDPGRASQEDLDAQRAAYAARGITGGELKYFRPKYGPRQTVQVAQGGEIGYADGGTIDLSGTINLGGQGARGGASAGMPNNSFTPMSGGLMGGLGALAFPDEIPRSSLVREHGGVSGNPMMLSNAQYDGRPAKKQTYEEYLAGRSPLQQDVQLTREQFENPAPYSTLGGPSSMFAKGGEIGYADGGTSDYEYDPASQTYKKVVQAPTGAVDPIGINGSDRTGDSSNDNQPLSQQTIDFLDKEENTAGARDARMGKINNALTSISNLSIIGNIAKGLMGAMSTPAAPNPGGYTSTTPGQYSGGPNSFDSSGPEATVTTQA
jgi:hypothetical protein